LGELDSSYEICLLNCIKDEYPFFIIEIAGEPISNERLTTTDCGDAFNDETT
jgi:hypothetical protein